MSINPFKFDSLISPISSDDFFKIYWEKKPLILNRKEKDYEYLIGMEDVESLLLTANVLSFPNDLLWVRFVHNNKMLSSEDFLTESGPTAYRCLCRRKILDGYNNGNTIILSKLEMRWEPIRKLCSELEKLFIHMVSANLYLTPPHAQGFGIHYDSHDVLILQISGEKHWKIYNSPVEFPLDGNSASSNDLLYEINVQPGDLLYIPRGYLHEARATEQHSLHLTIGIYVLTWINFMQALLKEMPELHKTLPRSYEELPFYFKSLQKSYTDPQLMGKILQRMRELCVQRSSSPPFECGLTKAIGQQTTKSDVSR